MNIAPIMIIENVYAQASDNKLRYIDKDRNILMEFNADFPIKESHASSKYCGGQQAILSANLYQPLIVEGRIFVQGFE